MKNYYKVLGIPQSALPAEIKKAYTLLAQQYDPTRNKGDKYAEERFIDISLAYKTLSDAEKRRDYDKILTDILSEAEEEIQSGKNGQKDIGNSDTNKRWVWGLMLALVILVAVFAVYRKNVVQKESQSAVAIVDTVHAEAAVSAPDTVKVEEPVVSAPIEKEKIEREASKETLQKNVVKDVKPRDTTTVKPEPVKEKKEEPEYVYVGANKSYVLDVQGTPTSITRFGERSEQWHYGASIINFVDNKVVRIRNTDSNLKLKKAE